jgi:hypothetical protein
MIESCRKSAKVYSVAIDAEKAFDSLWRDALFL